MQTIIFLFFVFFLIGFFLGCEQNEQLLQALENTPTIYPPNLPDGLVNTMGFQANVFWLYYNDIPAAQEFYEDVFGLNLLVDQDFAKVYSSSPTGFIGLVDQAQGLHKFTEQKAVTVSFFSEQIEQWYQRFEDKGVAIRAPLAGEGRVPVRTFVGYDPAGYFIEFDHFLAHPDNEKLLRALGK